MTDPRSGAGADDVPALDADQLDAYFALMEAVSLLQHQVEQQLRAEGGISYVQFQLLARLNARGQLTMTELADGVVYSRSGLTYQISQLEKDGLVRREKCPSDERGILAILTGAGRAALARAAPGHLRVVRENLIDALTPAQRETLTEGLAAARDRLRPGADQ